MNVDSKIAEAEFFFKKVNTLTPKFNKFDEDENEGTSEQSSFEYYMSAFLGASRSITEYLLYDYAIHFGLINKNKFFNKEIFLDRAKRLKKIDAINFMADFNYQLSLLDNDENYKFLKNLRDTSVHKIPVEYTIAAEAKDLRKKKFEEYHNKLIFLDDPDLGKRKHMKTAVQRCRSFIKVIKNSVKLIRKKYPI